MHVKFGFDVSSIHWVEIDVDDEEVEGMTEEEIIDYLRDNFEDDAYDEAEEDCDYSVGILDAITFNGEEHWVGN